MIAHWPHELPRPMRQGYQMDLGDGRKKARSESGPPRIRRRLSSVADSVGMTVDLDRDQLARFDRFYIEEINKGALPFLMPDPTISGQAMFNGTGMMLFTHDGQPLLCENTWLCLLGDQMPTRSVIGVRWRVAFQITVLP